jgi:hypothetical protein
MLRIKRVATSGAVPLKIVKLMLKTSAAPVKRMRVGKRSVNRQANEPLVRPAMTPAAASSTVRSTERPTRAA